MYSVKDVKSQNFNQAYCLTVNSYTRVYLPFYDTDIAGMHQISRWWLMLWCEAHLC
jgi:hypothetical protein